MICSAGKRKRPSEVQLSDRSENGLPVSAQESQLGSNHGDENLEGRPNKKEKIQSVLEGDWSPPLPLRSNYLPIVLGGSHWCGRESFENLIIIGDSYTKLNDDETWVYHLGRQLQKETGLIKIHNFAFPGATGEYDLSTQLTRLFDTFPKKESDNGVPVLAPDKTTYIVFLGINDCGSNDVDELDSIVETVLDAVHTLYVKAGGRNFVLVNVPPIDRSPQAMEVEASDKIEERVKAWNDFLQAQVIEFGNNSKEATVFLFSSHQVLTEVLEDPSDFDFSEDDPTTEGGGIWKDDLHLTTEVHNILGEQLSTSMFS